MSDYSYRNIPVMNDARLGDGFCAERPMVSLAELGLCVPDPLALMGMAGDMANSQMSELVCLAAEVEQAPEAAPAVAPRERPRHDEIRKAPSRLTPEAADKAAEDRLKYTALLAQHRADIRAAADADRAAGLSTDAVARDDRMVALEDAHDEFASVDLGNGMRVSTPYYMRPPENAERGVEKNGFVWDQWMDRRDSDARAGADKALAGTDAAAAFRSAKGAKASAQDDATVMQQILSGRLWERGESDALGGSRGTFDAKRREFLAPDASPELEDAASVLAFARVAGFGTDCSGFVQHVLTGAGILPEGLYNGVMTGVTNLTSGLGQSVGGGTSRRGNKPVDAQGALDIQAGDTLNIGAGGHIGVVMDALDTGDEIVMQLSHSTANQGVYNGNTQVATQPEGVRDDIVVYDKKEGRWRAVDSAWGDNDLNTKYGGFYRMDDQKIDAQVAKDAGVTAKKPK